MMLQPLSMASRQDPWLQLLAFHCRCLRASHPSRMWSGSTLINRLASNVLVRNPPLRRHLGCCGRARAATASVIERE